MMQRYKGRTGISPPRAVGLAVLAFAVLLTAILAASAGASGKATARNAAGGVTFMSTQLTPVTEQQKFIDVTLKGFSSTVSFVPANAPSDLVTRLNAEAQAGSGTVSLAGATVGDLETVASDLIDLSDVAAKLKSAGIPQSLLDQAKLGTTKQLSIPWMQATYVMCANKKALPYLPKGADLNSLTWGQFAQWAKNLKDHFGTPEVGFPVAGLFPRFLEGYLVPSFTGRLVTQFESKNDAAAWLYLKNLWRNVNPQSSQYTFMQDPLLSGEVLVAWDHVARLNTALQQKPDDFVVFPAPAGPKGRGFLPVLATVGIPKTAPNPTDAKALIEFLDNISQQAKTISVHGFFPVIAGKLSKRLGPGLLKLAAAVKAQQNAKDALPSVLPIGLGAQSGAYAKVFIDTFTRLVVNSESNPMGVLQDEGTQLQNLLNAAGAHCWAPDPASSGVCQVG
jgi:multiple sugar transport system substrate-binding protein